LLRCCLSLSSRSLDRRLFSARARLHVTHRKQAADAQGGCGSLLKHVAASSRFASASVNGDVARDFMRHAAPLYGTWAPAAAPARRGRGDNLSAGNSYLGVARLYLHVLGALQLKQACCSGIISCLSS